MLEVNYKACAPNAKLREDSRLQEALGIYLVVLGVPELTAGNLADAKARLKYYLRVTDQTQYYTDAAELFDDSVGVRVNCGKLQWAQLSSKLLKDFRGRFGC